MWRAIRATQMDILRTLGAELVSAHDDDSGIQLSPELDVQRLPGVVDSVHLTWSRNPFLALPAQETSVGSVFEFTLRDGVTGVDIQVMDAMALESSGIPVRFLVPIGASVCGFRA